MKILLLTISVLLLATDPASALSLIKINISQQATNTVLMVQDNPVTIDKVQELMAKVGAIDTGQTVMVVVDANSPAETLLTVLKHIKDAGLKNVCIVPGPERNCLDLLSVQIMPKTNEFIDLIYGLPSPLGDSLEEVPDVEVIIPRGEQAVPAYGAQSAPSAEP